MTSIPKNSPSAATLILAAGASSRLGQPKQLIPFRGRSLLRHAAETALGSLGRPVVVVLGALAGRLELELAGLPVVVVNNPQWEEGMASSIRAGLAAVAPESEAAIIMLCDQPLLSARFLDQLVSAHQTTGRGIVAAAYGGSAGVPALFSRSYFAELATLSGSRGAKHLIASHDEDTAQIPFPDASLDIDRPEDLAQLQTLHLED